jgi:phosphoserine phosphatase
MLVSNHAAQPTVRFSDYVAIARRIRAFASDGRRNLKGSAKAEMLSRLFPAGFVYAGDSAADLKVWRYASGVVLVNARSSVAEAARGLGKPILELSSRAGS